MFATVSIKKFGKRGDRGKPTAASPDTDQVISGVVFSSRAAGTRAPGPGLKLQATSFKHQASSFRTNLFKHQAASVKPLAASVKLKPTSVKLHDA